MFGYLYGCLDLAAVPSWLHLHRRKLITNLARRSKTNMAIKMLSKLCVTKLLLQCHQFKPRHLCTLNFLMKKTVNYVSFGSQSDGFATTTKVVLSVFFVFLLKIFIGNRGNEVFSEGFVKYKECVSH